MAMAMAMAPCLSASPGHRRTLPATAIIGSALPLQVSLPPHHLLCLHHGLASARNSSLFQERSKKQQLSGERRKQAKLLVRAFSGKGRWNHGRTPAADRVLAALGYVLPLLDGMQYGRFLFAQFPQVETAFKPLFPLLRLYSSVPYANFVAFFTIYLALVRNASFPRYVRFNAMQACVLDVLIVIPLIVQRILSPRSGFGLDLLILFYNAVFASLLLAVGFGVVSCVLGKTLRIPFVADAADNQLF